MSTKTLKNPYFGGEPRSSAVTIFMPPSLKDKLKELAKRKGISLGDWALAVLAAMAARDSARGEEVDK